MARRAKKTPANIEKWRIRSRPLLADMADAMIKLNVSRIDAIVDHAERNLGVPYDIVYEETRYAYPEAWRQFIHGLVAPCMRRRGYKQIQGFNTLQFQNTELGSLHEELEAAEYWQGTTYFWHQMERSRMRAQKKADKLFIMSELDKFRANKAAQSHK